MEKALGIGGLFFRSKDSAALCDWYKTHLGVILDGDEFWQQSAGPTVFRPFRADSDYFADDKTFMVNFRVADMDAMIAQLEK